jgi:hypothetical protein
LDSKLEEKIFYNLVWSSLRTATWYGDYCTLQLGVVITAHCNLVWWSLHTAAWCGDHCTLQLCGSG